MNQDFLITAFHRLRLRMKSRKDALSEDDGAEDHLQEAFCRIWSGSTSVTGLQHAESLLARVARNIRIDEMRKEASSHSCQLNTSSIAEPIDSNPEKETSELYQLIDHLASRALSPRDKEILFRRDRDGWEFSDLAEFYGLSEANLRMIVSRGRKAIREIYRKQYGNV